MIFFLQSFLIRAKAGVKAAPPGPDYAEVIKDYIHSHQLKQNKKAMCEAILLAVDHGEYMQIILSVITTYCVLCVVWSNYAQD